MSKRSASEQVPKDMQARFDEITQVTDTFSQAYLTDEYASLCRQLAATPCRKRPSPLSQGKTATWACGLFMRLRTVNFLFDASQTPHVSASKIASSFGLSPSTMQAKSKQIRDLLGMYQMDPNWTLPSKIDDNLLAWMIQVNGLVIDARYAPREIQEEAFRKGLIPSIPGE